MVGPKFLLTMDRPRYQSINNSKFKQPDDRDSQLKSTSDESDGSIQTDEKGHQFWNELSKYWKSVNKKIARKRML